MIRIPIGNEKSSRVEVRSVAPDANPYMVMYSIFKTGLQGEHLDASRTCVRLNVTCRTTSTPRWKISVLQSGLQSCLGKT